MTTPIEIALGNLADEQATGCLHVVDDDGSEALIYLKAGLVYAVSVPGQRPQLGARLISSNALVPENLAEALEAQRTELQGWRLGELLVHLGFVEQDVVEAFVQEQVRDGFTDLMNWTSGRWRFRKAEKTREDVGPPTPLADLLAEVQLRRTAWEEIVGAVHGPNAVPMLAARGGEADITLDADTWSLLCKVDGERSVADLARECGFTLFEAGAVVRALVEAGLVDVEEDLGPDGDPLDDQEYDVLDDVEAHPSPVVDDSFSESVEAEPQVQGNFPRTAALAAAFALSSSETAPQPPDAPGADKSHREDRTLPKRAAQAGSSASATAPAEELHEWTAEPTDHNPDRDAPSLAQLSEALTKALGPRPESMNAFVDPFHVPEEIRLRAAPKAAPPLPEVSDDQRRRDRIRQAASAELAAAHAEAEAVHKASKGVQKPGHIAQVVDLEARREASRVEAERRELERVGAEEEAARLEAERIAAEEEAARVAVAEEAARVAAEEEAARAEAERIAAEEEAARIAAEAEAARIAAEEEAARAEAERTAAEEEAARIAAEAEAARIAAEEEAARVAAEEAARIAAEEEAARVAAEEEAARVAAEEEARAEAERIAAEEAARIEAERVAAEEEAARIAAEEEAARVAAEEEAARIAAEEEAARVAVEEAARIAAEEEAARIEAERVAAEEEAARIAAEEEAARVAAEEAARIAAEEEAARTEAEQLAAEEAARVAAEEEAARVAAEEEARAEAERIAAEEAARIEAERVAAEEEAARIAAEEEAARIAAEEEAARAKAEQLAAEEAARVAAEEEAARIAAEEEAARVAAEEEAARVAAEEDAARVAAEEEAARIAAEEEAARIAAEEEAARVAAEEEAARLAAEEAARVAAEYATPVVAESEDAELIRLNAEHAARAEFAAAQAAADEAATATARLAAEQQVLDDAKQAETDRIAAVNQMMAQASAPTSDPSHLASANAMLSELSRTGSTTLTTEGAQDGTESVQAPVQERYEPVAQRDLADTASLLRELSSLGFEDEPPAPSGPRMGGQPPAGGASTPRPVPASAAQKKKRGLFGR